MSKKKYLYQAIVVADNQVEILAWCGHWHDDCDDARWCGYETWFGDDEKKQKHWKEVQVQMKEEVGVEAVGLPF